MPLSPDFLFFLSESGRSGTSFFSYPATLYFIISAVISDRLPPPPPMSWEDVPDPHDRCSSRHCQYVAAGRLHSSAGGGFACREDERRRRRPAGRKLRFLAGFRAENGERLTACINKYNCRYQTAIFSAPSPLLIALGQATSQTFHVDKRPPPLKHCLSFEEEIINHGQVPSAARFPVPAPSASAGGKAENFKINTR